MAKSGKKAASKTEIILSIAEATELPKKKVAEVLDALANEIKKSLGNKGPGAFVLPGLIKVEKKKVPAKPARKGVMVLGQLRDIPAKPASVKVKVRALRALKAMVS